MNMLVPTLQWSAVSGATNLTQVTPISGSGASATGTAGSTMSVIAQAGQTESGTASIGGAGGNLNLSAGVGGTGTSSNGTTGIITLGTPTLSWASTLTAPTISQPSQGSVYTPQSIQITPQAPQGGSGTAAQNTPGGLNLNTSAPGTVGTAGAEAGYTVTRAGSQIAYIGSYNATQGGIWLGANAQAANSYPPTLYGGNTVTILNGNGGIIQFRAGGPAQATFQGGFNLGVPLGGLSLTPFSFSGQASPNTVACGTGGTQTISAAQAIIPFFLVTSGTLTSNCTIAFGTNAPTGYFLMDLSGLGTLGAFGVVVTNGTASVTLTSTSITNLTATGQNSLQIATHGVNTLSVF
jgi:hypothetical protein